MSIAFSRLRILTSISSLNVFFNMVFSSMILPGGFEPPSQGPKPNGSVADAATVRQRDRGDLYVARRRRGVSKRRTVGVWVGVTCAEQCTAILLQVYVWQHSYINVVAVTYKCDENQSSNMVQISVRPKTKQKLLEIQERDEQTSMDGVIRYLLFKAGEERDS